MNLEIKTFDKKKCLNIPSKGGLPVDKVRQLAEYLGLPSAGTKAFLCQLIEGTLNKEAKLLPMIVPAIHAPKVVKPLPPIPRSMPLPQVAQLVSPIIVPKTDNLAKLYAELDSHITANSEKYECCINQYEAEIANIDKRLFAGSQAKKVRDALDKIKKNILDKFYKKYQDFYFEYLHLLKVYGRDEALRVLKKWIPQLNSTYIRVLHETLASLPLDTIHYLFPPNYVNFSYYEEDKNRVCAKNPKRDISTLLCFRTYMMQFMTRLMLLSKTMDKENSGTVSDLTKVLEMENSKLSELQKYIDGLFLCRKDYCDTKNCVKKSRILRSPTCEPTYVFYQ